MTRVLFTSSLLTIALMGTFVSAEEATEQTTEIATAAPAVPMQGAATPQYYNNNYYNSYYSQAQAAMQLTGAQRRNAIRAMPILERPGRVGHFYGNTVRRRASRGR